MLKFQVVSYYREINMMHVLEGKHLLLRFSIHFTLLSIINEGKNLGMPNNTTDILIKSSICAV